MIWVSRCVAGILLFAGTTHTVLVVLSACSHSLCIIYCVYVWDQLNSFIILGIVVCCGYNGLFSLRIFQFEPHLEAYIYKCSHIYMPIIIVLKIKITIIVRAKFEFEMHIISYDLIVGFMLSCHHMVFVAKTLNVLIICTCVCCMLWWYNACDVSNTHSHHNEIWNCDRF